MNFYLFETELINPETGKSNKEKYICKADDVKDARLKYDKLYEKEFIINFNIKIIE